VSARGKARNRALDVLFEAEQRSVPALEVLRARREKTDQIVNPYTLEIVEGVLAMQSTIDEFLETYSQGWTLERMPSVDRIILRIGTWELLYNDVVGDATNFMLENQQVNIAMHDGTPLFIELPASVVLDITYTERGLEGDSS
jgi:N utilization substance protein B